MTKEKDPRHQRRQKIVQSLFAWSLNLSTKLTPTAKKIVKKVEKIDQIITNCAPKWPLEKINKTDLAILRLAIYELNYGPSIPSKVVIDEAIELAKEFGSENSAGFVNGALGAAYDQLEKKK